MQGAKTVWGCRHKWNLGLLTYTTRLHSQVNDVNWTWSHNFLLWTCQTDRGELDRQCPVLRSYDQDQDQKEVQFQFCSSWSIDQVQNVNPPGSPTRPTIDLLSNMPLCLQSKTECQSQRKRRKSTETMVILRWSFGTNAILELQGEENKCDDNKRMLQIPSDIQCVCGSASLFWN